jgi:hypothetical protein
MNTRITYTYRDASNYKAVDSFVASGEITPEQIARILARLNEGMWFIPSQVSLRDLQPDLQIWDSPRELDEDGHNPDDHPWHELEADGFQLTDELADTSLTVKALVDAFEAAQWDENDPNLPI